MLLDILPSILTKKEKRDEKKMRNERNIKLWKNNTCNHIKNTRVTSKRKERRITVSVTLKPSILTEARNHNLNISRITEQALQSILEYIQPQNTNESSKSLNACCLPRENAWAGSSVWYERLIRNQEVAGSNPARSTQLLSSKLLTSKHRFYRGELCAVHNFVFA